MTEKKLRIFKENYKKCKKKSTLKIIFKFFAMACSYTTYVLDTDPTFITGSTDPDLHHCYKCLLKFFKKR